jgi:hypothetical protein
MNLSALYHVIGTAVCVAASYAVNHYQRPSFDPTYAPQVYSEPRGSLALNDHGRTLTFPLMTSQVVAFDSARMGREYKLRELTLRAAGPREQPAKLEIYVELSGAAGNAGAGSGDPRQLARLELPVARSGRFGARPSYVMSDDGKPRKVISGSVMLTEVRLTEAEDPPRYHTEGRVELQVEGPSGGVTLLTGRLEGQLAWDAASVPR